MTLFKPYLRLIFKLAMKNRERIFVLGFLILFSTAVRLIEPYLYKVVVDELTNGLLAGTFSQAALRILLISVSVWFVLSVLNNILNSQSNYIVWRIGNDSSQWVHINGFKKMLKMDYFRHTQKHSSRICKIVDDADGTIWEMTNWWLASFVPAILGFCGMLAIAFSVSWQMTLVSLSIVPVGLGIIIFVIRRAEGEQHKVNKLWEKKSEHMADQIANVITYKLNQDERVFVKVQEGHMNTALNAQLSLNRKWRMADMLNPDAVGRFMVMGMGVYLVSQGTITLGTMFMFMGLLNEILTPLRILGDKLPQYSRRARQIQRFIDLQSEEDLIRDPKRPKLLNVKKVKGEIEFRNVSFQYPSAPSAHIAPSATKAHIVPGHPSAQARTPVSDSSSHTLKNVSFTMHAGEHVAMIGRSGAGKSTIMGLMTRLYDPTSGVILLDGVDIRDYKQAEYRALIGTVLQEHSLYSETVAQNIAYGKPKASRAEIVKAAKIAAAHEFIEKLPQGYDTLVGERGVRLSGGERQRLAIARAVLKNPKIVILDEPTSALDSMTEAQVQKGLITLSEGRTTLTIAHRLATVRNADKILVLKGGELIAQGPHHELLKNNDDYARMVELQTGGFLADDE